MASPVFILSSGLSFFANRARQNKNKQPAQTYNTFAPAHADDLPAGGEASSSQSWPAEEPPQSRDSSSSSLHKSHRNSLVDNKRK